MTAAQRWVLTLTSLATFMIALDGTIVTTALTTIRRSLNTSVEALEWTVSAYILTFAVLMLTASALGDRFGRRRVFVAGLALFTAASAACGLSSTVAELIAARAVQGVGAAVIMPLAIAQLGAAFPPRERGRAMGVSAGIIGLATAGGPFVGGVVAQGLAWQWLFWVNVPVGVLVIAGVLLKMAETHQNPARTHGPQARLDLVGVVLTTGGILGLVWALVRGNDTGWLSAQTLGSLAAGIVLTLAFVFWELRAPAPMVPMRFFTYRAFSAGNVASFALTGAMYGELYFVAQYYQTVLHYGPFGAGVRMMPMSATLLVFGPLSGRLADRVGERRLVASGLAVQALGLAGIGVLAGHHFSYPAMVPALIASGAGVSLGIPPVQKAVVSAVQPHQIGQASGAFSMLRQVGALFGTAVAVAVFAGSGSYASVQSFTDGFTAAMEVGAVLAAAGAAAGLVLPKLRSVGAAGPATATAAQQEPEPAAAR